MGQAGKKPPGHLHREVLALNQHVEHLRPFVDVQPIYCLYQIARLTIPVF
jgi:hypothetical protein